MASTLASCGYAKVSRADHQEGQQEEDRPCRGGGGRRDYSDAPPILAAAAAVVAPPSASVEQAAVRLARPMTWTDPYFAVQDDIVAVFDRDIASLEAAEVSKKVNYTFYVWWVLALTILSFLGAFIIITDDDDDDSIMPLFWPWVYLVLSWLGLWLRRHFVARQMALEQERNNNQGGDDDQTAAGWPHTAVTLTGVRHVVPPACPSDRQYCNGGSRGVGYVLDLPFADLLSIKIIPLFSNPTISEEVCYIVLLTMAAKPSGDGIEYMTSGYCQFCKMPCTGHIRVALHGLKDPAGFKKLVLALQDWRQALTNHTQPPPPHQQIWASRSGGVDNQHPVGMLVVDDDDGADTTVSKNQARTVQEEIVPNTLQAIAQRNFGPTSFRRHHDSTLLDADQPSRTATIV